MNDQSFLSERAELYHREQSLLSQVINEFQFCSSELRYILEKGIKARFSELKGQVPFQGDVEEYIHELNNLIQDNFIPGSYRRNVYKAHMRKVGLSNVHEYSTEQMQDICFKLLNVTCDNPYTVHDLLQIV